MRTLETLGACRKLITANKDIANYDFYSKNNISVWHQGTALNLEDVRAPYLMLDKDIYESYSISSFVKTLINTNKKYSGYFGF